MPHVFTDILSNRSWAVSTLARPGTGRHRGRCADEDCTEGDTCTGHGRHRRLARPALVPASEESTLPRSGSALPPSRGEGAVPGWEHRTGDEFAAIEAHTLYELH
ncbi:hypothetical protein [Streptomyces sp. NPDC006527]|jgi:hypothetical protein|uniref:hypothetical protein n=1 Tax=Streptomyces sp. NPDC006527 TaxID=3364749 RepID=UPI00367503EC